MSRVAKHQNQKWYLKTNQIYVIHALDKESKAQLAGARAGIWTQDFWSKFNSLSSLSHSHHTRKIEYKDLFSVCFSLFYSALGVTANRNVVKFEFKPLKKV